MLVQTSQVAAPNVEATAAVEEPAVATPQRPAAAELAVTSIPQPETVEIVDETKYVASPIFAFVNDF